MPKSSSSPAAARPASVHTTRRAKPWPPAGRRGSVECSLPGLLCGGGQLAFLENQKIAACGSSYRNRRTSVGAAAGCDLFQAAINRDPYPATYCPAPHHAAPNRETTPPPDAAT